jgi:hypothetical protein
VKAFLIALILLTDVSVNGQSNTTWKTHELSGRVRALRIEIERTDASGRTHPRVLVQKLIIDERGNTLESEVYNLDGSPKFKNGWGHEYDAEGREIKTLYYNDKGQLTNTGVTTYDDKGQPIATTQINPNGSINHIRSYGYDEKGKKVRESHRNDNGSPRNLMNYKYDANGRTTEQVFIAADGNLLYRNVYTYDERGRQTSWSVFKNDGSVVQMFRRAFTYDDRGNIKEVVNYDADQSVSSKESYAYEFDDQKNWIKRRTVRTVFKEGGTEQEVETTYRILTYF